MSSSLLADATTRNAPLAMYGIEVAVGRDSLSAVNGVARDGHVEYGSLPHIKASPANTRGKCVGARSQ